MFCALLTSRYQVSVYRNNGPLVKSFRDNLHFFNLVAKYLLKKTCFSVTFCKLTVT